MNARFASFLSVVLVLLGGLTLRAESPQAIALVPQPLRMVAGAGTFTLTKDVAILVDKDSPEAADVGSLLAERINRSTGLGLTVAALEAGSAGRKAIRLTTKNANPELGAEGYTLEATPEGIVISATAGAGLFYGTQTLLQLLPPQVFQSTLVEEKLSWAVPAVRIEDKPRFAWRGLLLDVARHFFSKAEIENYIDLMAQEKLNTLQLHLTDCVGWRVEIKRFPKLTEIGAWRDGIGFELDPKLGTAWGPDGRYGGFYTQDDIREIVAYAKARYVTIIPEIEMPGHAGAAMSAYGEYSCAGVPFDPSKQSMGIVCPGNEGTFEFLEGILSEVIDLFPGKYLHIGGDEVGKGYWKQCPRCQARIQQEGLKDENELQSYFVRRIEKFLNAHGRTLIGWDEILQGGLAPNATVMSWRGDEGGIAAAHAGHDVIMTPNTHCYFDYYQAQAGEPKAIGNFLPLRKVYAYEPVPSALEGDQVRHVLGAGGNLWTEFVPNFRHAQYMTYPRACAMAEVTWSDPQRKNWEDFRRRLDGELQRLKAQGVNYRQPRPEEDAVAP